MTPGDFELRVERFKAACQAAGVKLTRQRLAIFREVAASATHPDAETVFQGVRHQLPQVSLDTVYRTLWTLTDLGLLASLGPRHERARFDANLDPHQHYVCVRCGRTRDFESPALAEVRLPEEVRGFGTVTGTQVEVHGVCAECLRPAGQRE